jgi:UDP-3-O-[3-hydroxymyristoyl] glucosamine N-acyltransferase
LEIDLSTPQIKVKNPRLAMLKILKEFASVYEPPKGIHPSVVAGKDVQIGKGVSIQAFVTLGDHVSVGDNVILFPGVYIGNNCSIGEGSIIYPSVTLYPHSKVGKRVIIHSGAVIGSDGFGYVPKDEGYEKVPQIGSVVIEDDVEIGANATIDRGAIGATTVKKGTKIDNLVHIAHNCVIGEHCAIAGQAGFSGGVTLKDRVQVGGQSGFSGHITIGENSIIMGRSGVTKDIPPGSIVSGFPAQDHKKEMYLKALLRRLPELLKK